MTSNIKVIETVPGRVILVANASAFATATEIEGSLKEIFGQSEGAEISVCVKTDGTPSVPNDLECRLDFPFNDFTDTPTLVHALASILDRIVDWSGECHALVAAEL